MSTWQITQLPKMSNLSSWIVKGFQISAVVKLKSNHAKVTGPLESCSITLSEEKVDESS